MGKSNKLDLRYIALLMFSFYIVAFPQASRQLGHQTTCVSFKSVIFWDIGPDATFSQQKNFLQRLIMEIPHYPIIITSTLGNTSNKVMKFIKDDSSWINAFAKFKHLNGNNCIRDASIRKAIDMYLDHNATTKIAEELFLFVDDRSKIDDAENAIKDLKRKKTFVIHAGEKAPTTFWTNLATDKHHLLKLSSNIDNIGDEEDFLWLSCKDSRLYCDTNLYWDGSSCVNCTHICSMVNQTVSPKCSDYCPYFDRTPPSTDSSIHQTNENEVGIAQCDKKWFAEICVIICILTILNMFCFLVCMFKKAQQGRRLNAFQVEKHSIFEQGDLHQGLITNMKIPVVLKFRYADELNAKDDWESCLQSKHESRIKKLLQENIIPNSSHLNAAYRIFKPSSEILGDIFALVSEYIKNQSLHILRVYAAYHDRKNSDSSYCFLVFTKQSAASQVNLNVLNVEYPIKIVHIEDCSQEDEDVVEASLTRYSQPVYPGQIENSISEHSERLMKETKNITLITTCMFKSRNYQRGKPLNLVEGPCIVILVMLKNWIPIGCKPLPKKINGISVDVREGIAVQFTGKLPTEKHENVRIGCKIESSVFPGSGNSSNVCNQGTLSGFIHGTNSLIYGFTCAHILFPDEVLRQMQMDDQLYVGNDLGLNVKKGPGEMSLNTIVNCSDKMKVYQASCEENEYLGTVEMAVYTRGGTFDFTGVDFAVVKIDEKRIPNTTKFPYFDDSITFNREMDGASAEREFHFKSGKVIEEDLKSGEKVIKYGCKTQLTEGYFQRKCTFNFIDGEKWHGQCEIIAKRGFAKPSDSGSLVFKPKDGDLEAACILLGGTTTRFAATHLADVLERTGLKDVKFLKFDDPKANEDSM